LIKEVRSDASRLSVLISVYAKGVDRADGRRVSGDEESRLDNAGMVQDGMSNRLVAKAETLRKLIKD
jgi:hypothetical protein